jgi:glycosyltransferase involved in cell wall biosynthesis
MRSQILSKTLQSFTEMRDEGLQWEIVLADNANDPDTRLVASQFEARLPLLYVVESRTGKAYAMNTAIEKARGELVIFTDDDILADQNWLLGIWEGAKRWPNHSVFGGKILPHFPTDIVKFDLEHRLVRSALVIADWGLPEGEYKSSMVWGPNFAIRSHILEAGFRFNTDLGPAGERSIMGDETEFVYRLEQAGHAPVYLPEALVHHQIRPEQLSMEWLRRRVASSGGTYAFTSGLPDTPLVFGVPRYMYIQILHAFLRYLSSCLFSTSKHKFNAELAYWYRKGMFRQYWAGVPEDKTIEY